MCPEEGRQKHESKQPAKEFTREETLSLLDGANRQTKALILLGLNAGYGPADCGRLEISQIDFEGEWLGEVRGKTGVARGCWLWPETIEALRDVIDNRVETGKPELDKLVFITKQRRPVWEDGGVSTPISLAFRKLKTAVGITKAGVGIYAFRHTFRTIADGARSKPGDHLRLLERISRTMRLLGPLPT